MMKETPRKLGALFLSAAMLTSLAANAAAADQMLPETDDTHYTAEILNSGISNFTTKKAPPDVRQRLRCCCIQFTRRDVACQARGGKIAPLYKAHPKSDRKV